jgi:hypothetical protein
MLRPRLRGSLMHRPTAQNSRSPIPCVLSTIIPEANGVLAYLHQQAVDTTTPGGRALFQMMGVFAEFERAMIRDRVKAGLANARAKGVKLGAPRTELKVIRRIEREKAKGLSVRAIATKLRIGAGTVHRVLSGGMSHRRQGCSGRAIIRQRGSAPRSGSDPAASPPSAPALSRAAFASASEPSCL